MVGLQGKSHSKASKDGFALLVSLREQLLQEKTRQELINKSKSGAAYAKGNQSKGKNRWERRRYSQIANSVRDYNQIDMDAFFKGDILEFKVKVHGETDDYEVTVLFEGILAELRREVQGNHNKLEFKCVLRALLKVFNVGDVYVNCNCLHPNTKIKLLDGTTPTIKEMKDRFDSGEKLYVYSTDSKGDFKPGEVEDVWVAGQTNEFVKVVLDDGEEILTTPEHPYMIRNGEYVKAKDLKSGDSLMPMYFNSSKGYTTVKMNTQTRGWRSVYKLVAEFFKKSEIDEAMLRASDEDNMNYKVAIHHKDFNKKNNNPENLQVMTAREHWDYHASLSFDKLSKSAQDHIRAVASETAKRTNANPTQKMIEARSRNLKIGQDMNYLDSRRKQQSEVMRKARREKPECFSSEACSIRSKKVWENPETLKRLSDSLKSVWNNYTEDEYAARCEINKQINAKYKDKIRKAQRKVWENYTDEERANRAKINEANSTKAWKEHPERFKTEKYLKARHNALKYERTPEAIRAVNLGKVQSVINKILKDGKIPSPETYDEYRSNGYIKWQCLFSCWEDLSAYFKLNHKVKRVEFVTLAQSLPVYDIKVKEWHNFVVDAGVVLHNCKDFTYRFKFWAHRQQYSSAIPDSYSNMMPKPTGQGGASGANDKDDKGAGCKHINLVISNTDWMMKIASVINNYIKWCKQNMGRNYADYIFPQVYGMPYKKAIQLSLFDDPNDNGLLPSDQKTIGDIIDKSMRGKDAQGRWTKDNTFKFQKTKEPEPKEDPRQMHLDLKFGNAKRKELSQEEEGK